jgi:uncharacterized protein
VLDAARTKGCGPAFICATPLVMIGSVRQLGLFPVKSMQGESPVEVRVEASGVVGDRTHGLFDVASGKVASAKDPRAWGQLLGFRAVWSGAPGPEGEIVFTLPDGTPASSRDPDIDDRLSQATGRPVRLIGTPPPEPAYDYVWDVDGIAPEELVTTTSTGTNEDGRPVSTLPFGMGAPGTFQDLAPMTIMTTASLAAMAARYPEGDWSVARFRPNLLLDVEGDEFVENSWVGRQLSAGGVVLEVTSLSPRCVMTTLAQPGLPRDRGILQAVARHNRQPFAAFGDFACLGAYANVVTPGRVAVGDPVSLQ